MSPAHYLSKPGGGGGLGGVAYKDRARLPPREAGTPPLGEGVRATKKRLDPIPHPVLKPNLAQTMPQ